MIRLPRRSLRASGIASAAVAGLASAMIPVVVAPGAAAAVAHPTAQVAGPMVPGSTTVRPRADADATVTSETWFGYAAYSGSYTSVESTWVEPTVDCSKGGGETSIWVGLDGATNSTVEQTGTEVSCSLTGQASYSAWWETYPSNIMQTYKDTVKPGDMLTAKVTFEGNDKYDLYLTDKTQDWTEDNLEQGASGASNSSAEVVGETPEIIPGYVFFNLPDFGTLNFTNSLVDGRPIGDSNPNALNLARFGSTLATTGSLTNGTDFTETWQANA